MLRNTKSRNGSGSVGIQRSKKDSAGLKNKKSLATKLKRSLSTTLKSSSFKSSTSTLSKSDEKSEDFNTEEEAKWSPHHYDITPAGLPGERLPDPMNSRNFTHFDPTFHATVRQHEKKPRRFDASDDEELYDRLLKLDEVEKEQAFDQIRLDRHAKRQEKKMVAFTAKAHELDISLDTSSEDASFEENHRAQFESKFKPSSLVYEAGNEDSFNTAKEKALKSSLKRARNEAKAQRKKEKSDLVSKELPTDSESRDTESEYAELTAPSFLDFARARNTLTFLQHHEDLDFTGQDERFKGVLDPFNPPNLSYEHVKLLKNIDYSPLLRRAEEGGQFTTEDVIAILKYEGVTDSFKSAMRREHLEDPVVYSRTYDVFNKGRKPCPLCLPDPTLDQVNRIHYTNVNLLRKYLSTSGMIIPRNVSGVCVTHQRKLRYAIKNAKQLALLSYTSNWHVPFSYVDPEKFASYEDQHAAADVERERRIEIKSVFDNLVNDKKALLSGQAASDTALIDGEATVDDPLARSQAVQFEAATKIRDSKIKLDTALATTTDEAKIAELHKLHEFEVTNINYDMNKALESAEDNSIVSIRADFGELLNLDTFDLEMSFDQFVEKYNTRMVENNQIKPMTHEQILLQDSDQEQETPQQKYRAQRDQM